MTMDRIIVLQGGQIITHVQLLALGGLYARLWSMQASGYIVEKAAPETGNKAASM
jgi:hypothetical protein